MRVSRTHLHTNTYTRTYTNRVLRSIYYSLLFRQRALLSFVSFGAIAHVHETNFLNRCDAWRGHLIRQNKMSFYKFCWRQELNILKESSFALVRFWYKRLDVVAESIKF